MGIRASLMGLILKTLPDKQFKSLVRIVDNINGYGSTSIELEVYYFLSSYNRFFEEQMHVIDIGGHHGAWTLELIKKSKSFDHQLTGAQNYAVKQNNLMTIIVIEPNKFNFKILKDNLKKRKNLKLLNLAVGEKSGWAHLCSDTKTSSTSSISSEIENKKHKFCETVKVKSLMAILDKNPRINSIKMDIEGSEFSVLNSINVNKTNLKLIQFEFGNPPIFRNISFINYFQNFYDYFANYNWKLFRMTSRGLIEITEYSCDLENRLPSNYLAIRL